MPRRASARSSAATIVATQPWPPHSATKRPPGRSARQTPAITSSARFIQCSAALLNTASNSSSKASCSPSITRASRPRARAAATCAALPSTPTTSAAESDELLGERAVAAAEIEDALAALRREQLDDRRAEVGDEARVARVALGIPGLRRIHGDAPVTGGRAMTANTRSGQSRRQAGVFGASLAMIDLDASGTVNLARPRQHGRRRVEPDQLDSRGEQSHGRGFRCRFEDRPLAVPGGRYRTRRDDRTTSRETPPDAGGSRRRCW